LLIRYHCEICRGNGKLIGMIPKRQALYRVIREVKKPSAHTVKPQEVIVMDLHCPMGHIAPCAAQELVTKNIVVGLSLVGSDEPLECEACVKAKLVCHEVIKEQEGEQASVFGQEIWLDIWAPPKVPSLGGRKYFVSFTDDYSRWTTIFLLETKDIFEAYKTFKAWVETHLKVGIVCLHSDCGGEYMSKELIAYLDEKGTAQKLTVHDTPEENGVSECLNHTLMEKV
jgi:hypothetical protein